MPARRLLLLLITAGFAGAFGIRTWLGPGPSHARTFAQSVDAGPPNGATTDPLPPNQAKAADPTGKPASAQPPESVESVLAAYGFELSDRLARFLPLATVADLEQLFHGLNRRPNYVPNYLNLVIFLRWMELDPAGGLEFAGRHRAADYAWRAWGHVNADAALAAASQLESRSPGVSVLEGIADADPLRARALIDAHPEWADEEAYHLAADGLMRTDPAAGATLRVAFGDVETSEEILAWVRRAPDDALAWARSLPDQQVRTEAMKLVHSRWARSEPEQAGAAILALPEGRLKRGLFADHAGVLAAAGDLAAARAWLERAPSATLRSESLTEIARVLAESDPSAALATLRDVDWSLTGPERRAHQILSPEGIDSEPWGYESSALWNIASKVPAETMDYVAELPESAPVDELTRQVFHRWLAVDSLAASEWLAAQPDGPIKVPSTSQLVGHLIRKQYDIESAAHWAMTLPPEADGTPAVESLLREWLKRGAPEAAAEAAREAIESLPLSPEEKHRLADLLPAQP